MGMIPQSFSSASNLAGSSLATGTLSTGMQSLGSLFSGVGASQQYSYAADVAHQNAQAALMAGQQNESQSKGRYSVIEAQQKVSSAANGVGVNAGSAVAVRDSTAQVSAMDAALLHYNAAREAFGQETQAGLDRAASKGAFLKGLYGAGASFLSGASNVGSKWMMYQADGLAQATGKNPMTLPQLQGD